MNAPVLRTPRWILTALLVLAGIALTARLGFWQLDRLQQRRAFNARVLSQMAQPVLDLNSQLPVGGLYDMEYRNAVVRGRFVSAQQVILRNQAWDHQAGYHILTPLLIEGSPYAVLVDRGWIPFEGADDLSRYDEPGLVTVKGVLRRPQSRPDIGGSFEPTLAPGQSRFEAVNLVNLELLQGQVDAPLLPVYVHENPDPAWKQLPYRSEPDVEISEGPHLGYAIQWFIFSAMMAVGFPLLTYREMHKRPGATKPYRQAQGKKP